MSGTTNTSGTLNQAAAHDTSLYDPTVHDNQIVALYETDAQARTAQQTLVSAGFPASSMQIVARDSGSGAAGTTGATDEGLWGSIKSLFVPDEDRTTYNTAVARGHAMLVVTPTNSMDRQHLIHTLESTDPLDFDAKLEEWRQTGYDTTGSAAGTSTSNTATAGHAVDAGMNTGYATAAGTGVGAATTGLAGQPKATTATTAVSGAPAATTGQMAATDANTLKVMEERLRVGKREVAAGAVRIRSYIVERPVEEKITLHEERVGIERRPVDRAASPADFAAFEERTIEARATSEEAVVSKDARVIEEIGLKKEASDRVETVRDTVRKTEVEIEDPVKDTSTLGSTTTKTTVANPNTTPGATTSGANSPRK